MMGAFLRVNGRRVIFDDVQAFEFVIDLYEGGRMRFHELDSWLRSGVTRGRLPQIELVLTALPRGTESPSPYCRFPPGTIDPSGQHRLDDLTLDIRQPEIATLIPVRQLQVIEPDLI